MADSVYIPGLAAGHPETVRASRHSALVRITHWINAVSFVALLVSGIGILLAHPRFYWGETGGLGTPSLFDLPLPFMLGGPSGWGRYLHFESAWVCVLNGTLYAVSGFATRHFRNNIVPSRRDLTLRAVAHVVVGHLRLTRVLPEDELAYNVLQRLAYLSVVFGLFPLLIWTGLAMSPAVTSVFPFLVTALGGHQCARTIHFFAAIASVLFVLVHVAMVWKTGFRRRMRAMITGGFAAGKEGL